MPRKNIRTLALCAVLSALGVVILLLGSFIEVLDLSAAILASLLITVAVIEAGRFWPWLTYAVITAISLLLLPNRLPAVAFLLMGYYPVLKEKLERIKNRVLQWIIKIALFNALLTMLLIILRLFFPAVDISLFPGLGRVMTYVVAYLLGNVMFVLYDIVLTRMISFYLFRLRDRLGIGKKR